ncbi:MAG: hypothetical protein A2599_00990 [Candidatus Staskawiczbacteria bacterium RIFOXYD1_FULL_39_28]|uniref:Uncharacterized protein n=1 Tax=Candidatus Staskawiczbacteria bacterium RIFOXYC1_FULL_38_18 TaxID=1802229 RepID=A0A1G2JAB8_9BACT|nr:MAG: hypothetical protein A2401_00710 [Candidatus Staskawiczbacteria bacterium RIFOXYC1_FULL_38_18]OGZ91411.1 MAG: hypothetical protein A2599_00990 [Candidatus Staskawiczbacteria bacterium RIFOXYD1_FULL_39_28]
MKIKIVKNKYLNALFLLMLFSAIVHMVILFIFAIVSKNVNILNYFNILNLNYFMPDFFNNLLGNITSFLFVILLYAIILKINGQDEV